MADNFRLVMSQGPHPGQTFTLDRDALTLGRESGNSIVIPEPQISRQHARITRQGGLMVIEDLGSTNGTYINGVRLTGPHTLANGDAIGLGEAVTLTYHGTAPAAPDTMAERPGIPQPPSYGPPLSPQPVSPVYPGDPSVPEPPFEEEEEPRGRQAIFIGCGCLVLLVILGCVAVFVLDYLALLPAIFYEPLRLLGFF